LLKPAPDTKEEERQTKRKQKMKQKTKKSASKAQTNQSPDTKNYKINKSTKFVTLSEHSKQYSVHTRANRTTTNCTHKIRNSSPKTHTSQEDD
jgi:short-subunit dehydrogenase involved in D-alanine esterification of teichoic acids